MASLPKITELFEKLEEAVCGTGSDERGTAQSGPRDAGLLGQRNQTRQLLPYAHERITRWLEFIKEYQKSKETNGAIGEYMKTLERRYTAKENELEYRLNEQGVDTSKLDSFNTPFRSYDDVLGKGLGMHKLEHDGSLNVDQNSSVIDDIAGARFQGFRESCWILLTS